MGTPRWSSSEQRRQLETPSPIAAPETGNAGGKCWGMGRFCKLAFCKQRFPLQGGALVGGLVDGSKSTPDAQEDDGRFEGSSFTVVRRDSKRNGS